MNDRVYQIKAEEFATKEENKSKPNKQSYISSCGAQMSNKALRMARSLKYHQVHRRSVYLRDRTRKPAPSATSKTG